MKTLEDQKKESAMIQQILDEIEKLKIPDKPGPMNSRTVQIPRFSDFKKRLPPDKDCSAECRLLRNAEKTLKKLVGKETARPWTFYRSEVIGIDWSLDPPPKKSRRKGEKEFVLNGHYTTGTNQTTAIAQSKGRKKAKGLR